MSSKIKGITIEIGGNTVGLNKALAEVNKKSRDLQGELHRVEKLLKLDPKNTELLSQKQKLLAESVANTKGKLESLKEAEKQVQKQFKKGEVSEEQYRALQREIVSSEQKLKSLETQSRATTSAMNKIAGVATKIGNETTAMGKKILPTSLAIAGVGTASLAMSSKFEDAMADVNTLLDDESHLEGYKNKVRQISDDLNIDLLNSAQGMYQAISSIGDGIETSEIFSTMAKSAKAGSAETADAVALISSAMKGYGEINDKTAQKISDLSFVTAKLGVTTFPEMAKNMQPLFPLAKGLGIEMEELYGVMATGTGVTGNTAEVSTQFKAVMSNLMKPTKDMTELMEKYGYENSQAMIENEGLAGTLKILQEETAGQTDKLAKLFGSTQALTLVSALTGSQFDVFSEKLLAMGEASGATDEAFEKKQTQTEKLRASINKIKNSAVDLGVTLAPVLEKISKILDTLANKIKSITPAQMKLIALIGGFVAVIGPLLIIIGKLATGVGVVINLFNIISPVLATVAAAVNLPLVAITALVGAVVYLWNTSEGFRNFIIGCWEMICNVVKARVNEIANFFTIVLPQAFQSLLDWINNFFITDWRAKFGAIGLVVNYFRDNMKTIFMSLQSVFQSLISFVSNIFSGNWREAWQNVVDIFKNVFDTIKDIALAPIKFVGDLIDGLVTKVKDAFNWLTKLGNKKEEVDEDDEDRKSKKRSKSGKTITAKLKMMAKGGVLANGEAIVAEAGPELIQMINGKAVVTPLSSSATNTQVGASKGSSTGEGSIVINNYSPKALTAAESARYYKRAQRELALGVR